MTEPGDELPKLADAYLRIWTNGDKTAHTNPYSRNGNESLNLSTQKPLYTPSQIIEVIDNRIQENSESMKKAQVLHELREVFEDVK